MKRIISLLLITLMGVSGTHSNELNTEIYSLNATEAIVEVGFHTSDGSADRKFLLLNLGHAFLSFRNLSDDDIVVGEYVLSPNEEITVGLWSILGKYGVWYNVESYLYNNLDRYQDLVSTTVEIDLSTLNKVNEYINSNPVWCIVYNCSSFVTEVLNIVTNSDLHTILMSPSELKETFNTLGLTEDIVLENNVNIGYFKNGEFVICTVE